MEDFKTYIDYTARSMEAIGVLALVFGILFAFWKFLLARKGSAEDAYKTLRRKIGMSILLGLEILVAADIIATVVAEPSMSRVLTLGLIVLIRTFLSLSIQVELEGRFPWQKKGGGSS